MRAARARTGRAHPVVLAACALCGVDEVYRMGGAQAIAALAYGTESVAPVDVIAGPGQRVRAGGQAPGGGRRWASTASPGPASWWWWPTRAPTPSWSRSTCSPRPSTAPDGLLAVIAPDRDAARRGRAPRSSAWRPSAERGGPPLRRRARRDARAARARWPRSWRPSTWSWWAPRPRRCAGEVRPRGLPVRGRQGRHRVRRLRGRLQPRAAHRRRGAVPVRALGRHLPAPDGSRIVSRAAPPRAWPRPGAALARAEGFPVHAESMERRA